MKKISTLLLVGSLINISANSQIDLGVSAITVPANNSSFYQGFVGSTAVSFTVNNFSTTTLDATTAATVRFRLTINNTTVATYNPPSGWTLAAGTSDTLNTPAVDLGARFTSGANSLCVATVYTADPNNSNDSTCNSYTLNAATVDVSSVDISIVNPAPGSGNTIELGSSLTELSFTMRNNSTITIPTGSTIPYSLYIGSDVKQVNGTLVADWAPNTTTVRQITNTTIIPALPTVLGNFKLCAVTRISSDPTASNDTTCKTYTLSGFTFTSFLPTSGYIGSTVVLNGQGFSTTVADNTVKFNGTAADVVSATATQITCKVPVGATKGKISVTVGGKTKESASNFDILPNASSVNEIAEMPYKVWYGQGKLNYELSSNTLTETLQLRVYNSAGSLVLNRTIDEAEYQGNTISVDVSHFSHGIYLTDLNGLSGKFSK